MHRKRTTPWARRRRRVLIACALCLLLLVPYLGWRMRLKTEVGREREALRVLGIPTTSEALAAWQAQYPELPTIEAYGKAATALAALPPEDQNVLPSFRARDADPMIFSVPYVAAEVEAMRKWVSLNEAALQLLREGRMSALQGRAIPLDRERGIRDLVALCCAAACVSAENGHGEASADAVLDGLALVKASDAQPWSRSLARSPDEVGQLVNALASAASRVVIPEEKLREIEAQMVVVDWVQEARLSAIQSISHRVQSLALEQGDIDSPPARVADVFLGFFDRYMTFSMRSMRTRFSLIGKSLSEQQAEFGGMKGRRFQREFFASGPPVHLTVATAGLEVIFYHQKTGKLPDSLDSLARDGLDLSDFFSGGTLIYRPTGDSFVLYSVGGDMKDDLGQAPKDVVFRGQWPAPEGASAPPA